jgi:DNA-binding NtrC family response regulator
MSNAVALEKTPTIRKNSSSMLSILLVEDDPDVRKFVGASLKELGHDVTESADGADAVAKVSASMYDVVVCDIRLPKADGLAVLRKARRPGTDVILMTSFSTVPEAVAALKEGAYDYLTKPFEPEELATRIARIAEKRGLERQLAEAQAKLDGEDTGPTIVGSSPAMQRLQERIATVAATDAPVLITGESGTGKELVAQTLHARSARKQGPFVAVNCAAFPETLLEAELFGHERGAFTGAVKRRDGRFKAADGGTLLLDEIAEIPLSAQAKLLRVLQEGIIEPLGTNEQVHVNVRVISATHRNLKKRIQEGLFREDLYYRLNVVNIQLPPLRDRRGDLPLLLQYFRQRFTPPGEPLPEVSLRAWAALSHYAFPGNVREFAHAVQHAVVLARGTTIDVEHLPEDIAGVLTAQETAQGELRSLHAALKEFEREYLLRVLTMAQGKRVRAAEMLGISRKNLWEKLRAHNISDADIED